MMVEKKTAYLTMHCLVIDVSKIVPCTDRNLYVRIPKSNYTVFVKGSQYRTSIDFKYDVLNLGLDKMYDLT